MAEPVVSFVVERLGDSLIREADFLHGVSEKIEQMRTELTLMQSFLKDADKRQGDSDTIRNLVSEIREVAYHAENVIETYVVKIASRRRGGIQNAIKRYACIINEGVELHMIGSQIDAVKTRISGLKTNLLTYGIMPNIGGEGSSFTERTTRNLRCTYSHVEEDTVGLDEDVNKLVALLVNEEKNCPVVTICGMGGLGKTTLARKVYRHNNIKRHFDAFAWASVSQQFQPRNIWEGILIGLISPSPEQRLEIKGLREEELVNRLYEVQQKKKCLVILDDIWGTDAWDNLRAAFPIGKAGNRMLLTTRNKEVVEHPTGFLHELRCLNEEDSWELLQKKTFPRKDDPGFIINPELKNLGRKMVGQCSGLPLAIVVLGGILATKHTLNEWIMVYENIKSYLRRGKGYDQQWSGVQNVLALSYHELPYQLKPCFLHLGHFPEDYAIPAKKLFKLWVAEGIVFPMQYEVAGEETLEDVAEHCLYELIQRCMVQVGTRGSTGTVKTCQLHDLMRDFCLSRANEENFLKFVHLPDQNRQVDSLSSRRLGINLSETYLDFFPTHIITPYLQSLSFFAPYDAQISPKMITKFSNFKLLKVLDFDFIAISGKFPRAIGNLVHLRYLRLCFEGRISIPSSIGNLRFLQTLNLQCWGDTNIRVPNVIWKMEQLRHLYLNIDIRSNNCSKLRLGNLSNLQTLEGFEIRNIDVKELTKLTNLRKLRIKKCKSLEEFEGALISRNASLNRLCSLSIWGVESEVEESDLQRLFSGCHHLYKLFLWGKIRKLPEYHQFPPNLTKLGLHQSCLKEDPMATLEKLPHLSSFWLSYDAFVGKEMVCSSKGFPQLKSLGLKGLHHLEEWSVSDEAMPTLCKLIIWGCPELKMIPNGLRLITTLQELNIRDMPEAFKKRVQVVNGEGGEDSYKVQHVPSIIFQD